MNIPIIPWPLSHSLLLWDAGSCVRCWGRRDSCPVTKREQERKKEPFPPIRSFKAIPQLISTWNDISFTLWSPPGLPWPEHLAEGGLSQKAFNWPVIRPKLWTCSQHGGEEEQEQRDRSVNPTGLDLLRKLHFPSICVGECSLDDTKTRIWRSYQPLLMFLVC